jgi:glycerol uptake facilitator
VSSSEPGLWRAYAGEIVGTFLLAFFGTGSVFVGVLTGALVGLFQVAVVWGIGIGLAIYAVGSVSGAHLNPAVTVAVATFRGFPRGRVLPYVGCQVLGAFLASAVLFGLFSGVLAGFEKDKGITRGQPGSQASAMVFGEYFPNPAVFGADDAAFAKVTHVQAFAAEVVGTALLVFFVFALTDDRNSGRPNGTMFAIFIGLAVAIIIAIIAPLTQAALNPARDFGPRLFSLLAGWGRIAIPGPRGGFFTVYILAPVVGGLVGGAIYETIFRGPSPKPELEPPAGDAIASKSKP